MRYRWRTDAASGVVESDSVDEALETLIAEDEWPHPEAELRWIEDGAWLLMFDEEGCEVARIGKVP